MVANRSSVLRMHPRCCTAAPDALTALLNALQCLTRWQGWSARQLSPRIPGTAAAAAALASKPGLRCAPAYALKVLHCC